MGHTPVSQGCTSTDQEESVCYWLPSVTTGNASSSFISAAHSFSMVSTVFHEDPGCKGLAAFSDLCPPADHMALFHWKHSPNPFENELSLAMPWLKSCWLEISSNFPESVFPDAVLIFPALVSLCGNHYISRHGVILILAGASRHSPNLKRSISNVSHKNVWKQCQKVGSILLENGWEFRQLKANNSDQSFDSACNYLGSGGC